MEFDLDDDAAEALLTITASTGLDTDRAINNAILGYATILQGREGAVATIYHQKGGKRTVLRRMLFISDLYESELALRAVRIAAACGFAILAVSGYAAESFKDSQWWDFGMAIAGAAALVYVIYDAILGVRGGK